MTHVFVVNETTFKYHLEYLFAGTGAKENTVSFLTNSTVNFNSTRERMLVGMIADISKVRVGDKVIFYLQATPNNQGMFYGVFKVVSNSFFDENDASNFLIGQLGKGLSFKVLIEPDEVYAKGITEHEYLDSLQGKNHPADLCWSLIYRKLKGNRGCTTIMDYEYEDLLLKLKHKNNNVTVNSHNYSFDTVNRQIVASATTNQYTGRQNSLNILPRLLYKASRQNSFETHLQAYITQNYDNQPLSSLLIPQQGLNCWIGNEVACGVGMQRIDLMLKQETDTDVFIRLMELKDESPYQNIVIQIKWYLEWISAYVIPKYQGKNIHIIPTIIAKGNLSNNLQNTYQSFNFTIPNAVVQPIEYIGFTTNANNIDFTRYL